MSGQTRSKKNQAKDQAAEITLTKEEQQIAKFLRLKCGSKQGSLAGMKVDFFIGNKLIDCLLESKWGPGKATTTTTTATTTNATSNTTATAGAKSKPVKEVLLANRAACVSLMQRLMNKQLFYRAVKIYKEDAVSAESESTDKTPNLRKRKTKETTTTTEATTTTTTTTTPKPTTTSPDSPSSKQQKESKRKFKLELCEDQKFIDANEPYVWVYDPVSPKTYIIGALLILGAIGICLFPLWPSQVREGVYYLSLAGASFLGAILGLALLKYVVYGIVWAVTFGTVTFWLFPNLTEDVGFVESFVPVYKCTSSKKTTATTPAAVSEVVSEEVNITEKIGEDRDHNLVMTQSMTASVTTRKNNSTTMTELSKSTVEISTVRTDSPSSMKTRKQSMKEEEDFELVDNEELNAK